MEYLKIKIFWRNFLLTFKLTKPWKSRNLSFVGTFGKKVCSKIRETNAQNTLFSSKTFVAYKLQFTLWQQIALLNLLKLKVAQNVWSGWRFMNFETMTTRRIQLKIFHQFGLELNDRNMLVTAFSSCSSWYRFKSVWKIIYLSLNEIINKAGKSWLCHLNRPDNVDKLYWYSGSV